MENPATNPPVDPKKGRENREADPVLLALPRRGWDDQLAPGETCLEQLQVIETGSGPKVETALLLESLKRSPGLEQSLVDPVEVHNYHNALADINAYKHRLHAIRCEYVELRMRLESELVQVRMRLESELAQVRASTMWRLANEFHRWRKLLVQYIRSFRRRGDSSTGKRAA